MNDFINGFALTLDIELAVLGLSVFVISLYGLIQAIKGLLAPSDDKVMTNEEFGKRLNSIHNIRFLIKMMEGARKAIQEDRFKAYKDEIIAKYGDERGF